MLDSNNPEVFFLWHSTVIELYYMKQSVRTILSEPFLFRCTYSEFLLLTSASCTITYNENILKIDHPLLSGKQMF